jgi:RNA polymerase sigma-70 factor (ECF subfamily)
MAGSSWQRSDGRQGVSLKAVKQLTPNGLSLPETICLAQRGDAAAFENLYQAHSRRVYALCLRMVGNPAEAEDLTQEAFLQMYRKIQTFRGESSFSTWLHRVTVNIVLMKLRRKRHTEVSLEESTERDEESLMPRSEFGATDLRLSGSIDRINLQRAIDQLPPGFKTIFLLHDIQGYKHHEIGEILGCSAGNSKSQLHKARMRLRAVLKRGVHGSPPPAGESAARSPAINRRDYSLDYAKT